MSTETVAHSRAKAPARAGLKRELNFFQTIALSVAFMGPTAAMALNPQAGATLVGRAVPLTFVFAFIGVALVAYAFVRLSQHFSHAGSVYAFSGATLGPRAGFLAGWALLGAYLAFTVTTVVETGVFGQAFLQGAGIWHGADATLIAVIATGVVGLLVYRDVRALMRALLSIEGISIVLITVLAIAVVITFVAGTPPDGQGFTSDVLSVPQGTSLDAVATAAVFGFLSFAGFEGSASLGEESDNPRRDIPRAIALAVVSIGVFYVVVSVIQAWGFGTDARGIKAFTGSASPLAELSKAYVGQGMADALNFGIMMSALGSAIGAATGGSRLIFALSRDAWDASPLSRTSRRTGAPVAGLTIVLAVTLAGTLVQAVAGTAPIDAYLYPATLGTLALLVAYAMTNAGALKLLATRMAHIARWQLAIPVLGIAFLAYTFYKNVNGAAFPYSRFPIVVTLWVAIGLAVVILRPGYSARIGRALSRAEGIEDQPNR